MSMIGFPLLLIPLAIYNIVVFLMQGVGFDSPIARLTLTSGRVWTPTFSDGLLALGMLLLILEMIKASRPGAKYFTDYMLSLLVFAGAAAEFAMLPQFATSTFFLLTVLALVDFLASIGIRSRRERPAKIQPVGKRQRKQQEPAFQPSAASDLASPTHIEPKLAPAAEPVAIDPPAAPAAPVAVADEADAEPKRDPAVITPQR